MFRAKCDINSSRSCVVSRDVRSMTWANTFNTLALVLQTRTVVGDFPIAVNPQLIVS